MNKEVSFPIAKLLKEKGFDKRTPLVWLFSLGKTHLREVHLSLELNNAEYNAPTIAEVVMWLYEKYDIWISVKKEYHNGALLGFEAIIDSEDGFIDVGTFAEPTRAYEAAIKYTLNHII